MRFAGGAGSQTDGKPSRGQRQYRSNLSRAHSPMRGPVDIRTLSTLKHSTDPRPAACTAALRPLETFANQASVVDAQFPVLGHCAPGCRGMWRLYFISGFLNLAGITRSVIPNLEAQELMDSRECIRIAVVMRMRQPRAVCSNRYFMSAFSRCITGTPGGFCA